VSDLQTIGTVLPATTPETLAKIERAEARMRVRPQLHIRTEHILHAGMYARTIRLAEKVAITSVLIKVPTMIVVNGACRVFAGDSWHDIEGFHVIPASAGRKLIYITFRPTEITMLFPSQAKNIEEAEVEFTDETELLLSRKCNDDVVTITGVPCQA